MTEKKYVLLTAARNEERHIERTINSVISQTILPRKWVIASDGSTDRTDQIVGKYQTKCNFIELVRASADPKRNFGSKARAIRFAYKRLGGLNYQFIGNLDADITFGPSYYEEVMEKFDHNTKLGIAGGIRYDYYKGKFELAYNSPNSVGGPAQFFHRDCFEAVGGYVSLKDGGIDAVAEITARMHGWEVRTFENIEIFHHRATGTAAERFFRSNFRYGLKFYSIGYHPLFFMLMSLHRAIRNPVLPGGIIWILGYLWAAANRYERPVSIDFVKYLRLEQMTRIRSAIFGRASAE